MGTWNAFYVSGVDRRTSSVVRGKFPGADIESRKRFMGVRLSDENFEAPEQALCDLSDQLDTDVFWLSFQSAADAFQFHHWRSGRRLRSLVYGCFELERTWEKVKGDPEPWEKDVLFDPKRLEISLDSAIGDEDRRELRRIWREGEIQSGRMEPSLDSRGCAHKIARLYGFPHYAP